MVNFTKHAFCDTLDAGRSSREIHLGSLSYRRKNHLDVLVGLHLSSCVVRGGYDAHSGVQPLRQSASLRRSVCGLISFLK